MPDATSPDPQSQPDKFKALAGELEADEDKAHIKEQMRKLVRQKPVEKPE